MKNSVFFAAVIAALFSATAFAGVVIPPPSPTFTTSGADSKTETRGYAGLNWTLGGGYTPALVLGVTNTKVKSNGDTTGGRLAFHLNLLGGITPGMLKLSYLNGKEDLQGEVGAGYNFIKSAPLLGLGVNAPYVAVGVDGYLNPGLVPYGTLHSQGKFSKPQPQSSVGSCPAPFTFTPPASCI